jgi:hypothetical protein
MATTGVDLMVISWRALSAQARDDAARRIHELHQRELAGEQSEADLMVASLRKVAAHLTGQDFTIANYKRAHAELTAAGETVEPAHRVIRHYASWMNAKEALELSETTSVKRIEYRFASRKLGKVWRYTDQTLREVLLRCCDEHGRPVSMAEFEFWRERELAKARAMGDHDAHLPADHPYRRRWGSWRKALLAVGFTEEEAVGRFKGS